MKELAVTDPKQWPDDDSRVLFGDETIVRLRKKFNLPAKIVVQQFCNVKGGKKGGSDYSKLLAM